GRSALPRPIPPTRNVLLILPGPLPPRRAGFSEVPSASLLPDNLASDGCLPAFAGSSRARQKFPGPHPWPGRDPGTYDTPQRIVCLHNARRNTPAHRDFRISDFSSKKRQRYWFGSLLGYKTVVFIQI